MNKFDKFLKDLEQNLYFFSEDEIEQILMDYKELYSDKIESGILEDEILKDFDTPKQIAKNYSQELNLKTSFFKKFYVNTKKEFKHIIKNINSKTNQFKEEYKEKKQAKKVNEEQVSGNENIEEIKNDSNISKKQRGILKVWKFIKHVMKIAFLLFYIICKLVFNIFRYLLIFMTIFSIVVMVIIYILSFIFIEININQEVIRFLETTIFISYTVCALIIINLLHGAFRE